MRTIKIVVFSGYQPLSLSLISRLDKEGHQVFVVTGSTVSKRRKPRAVFQEYHFPFTSESLSHIVKNINPDLVILGGHPDNLSDYIAGITNIMISLKKAAITQLLYLSSLSVFSGNGENEISEQTLPHPVGDRDKTILLGEKICMEYAQEQNYLVKILRLTEVYGASKTDYLVDNICADLCLQMINGETVEIQPNKRHHVLYLDDAVDGLYKVMKSSDEQDEIYHIVGEEEYSHSELEIVNLLKDEISYETKVEVIELEETKQNKTYQTDKIKALGFTEKYHLKDKIGDLYHHIKNGERRTAIRASDKESVLGRIFNISGRVKDKLLPYLENISFFILLNIFIYFTRSYNFHEVIDFYLLYVVVIALIYGFEQSVFTIILSVLAKVYFTIYVDIDALSLSSEYMYMWILLIFTIGTLVGYLKEQYKLRYTDMLNEKAYLKGQIEDIKAVNAVNLEVKELYESRLLNYGDSFGRIHEIVSELDLVEPQAIIFRAIRVIQQTMDTDEVSIYLASRDHRFFRLVASSANSGRKLKNSIKASEYIKIFEKLERKEIYVNKNLDPACPMMASGIYKNGHLQSIVMIWSIPFESNNLYHMNLLEITSRLIESKLNVAYEYVSNLSSTYKFAYSNMIDKQSFNKILDHYKLGQDEGIADYSLVQVKKEDSKSREDLLACINRDIRETDYMYESDAVVHLLLTNTSEREAQHVISRLQADGLTVRVGERHEQ